MSLYFINSSSVDAYVAIMWPYQNCGPFLQFRKAMWYKVATQQTVEFFAGLDLSQFYAPPGNFPFGSFYAEEFRGGVGNTWGDSGGVGVQPDATLDPVGPRNQCFDDPTGCTQVVDMATVAFNTAPNLAIVLKDTVPLEPNWEAIVF
jgi:hypothetical protein